MRSLAGVALAMFAMLGGTAAQAASPGYTTANVNIRTGPDVEYPSVGVIPEGDDIVVEGCLRDESWCDVSWAGNRGWVYSEYLAFDYRGETVLLPDVGVSVFRIPIITFAANDYWRRYYVGRPWYKDRNRWIAFRPRPRAGWHAPPPGPRKRGWWRSGYVAPRGMRAPPDRGWKRPARHERGGDRRDNRRDNRHDGYNRR
ncbi:MAG: SH3 domain-containing protein [Thermomicrobiales bacterium]